MKRLLLFLLLLLLPTIAVAEVTIVGPESLGVKEADLLYIDGVTADEFAKCSVVIFPAENKPLVVVLKSLNNKPVLFVKGQHAGKFAIILDVNIPDAYEIVIHELQIGGEGPVPPDPPGPDPTPDPQPNQKWRVLILFESDDLDNLPRSQQVMLASLVFRKKLQDAGHQLVKGGIVDQHIKDAAGKSPPSEVAAYFAACKGDPLPRICLMPLDGGKVLDFALPATEAGVFALLKKGGE